MDQDGSEHNICSTREGLCPGKEQHGAFGWKKIFQHGKEPLRNKDSVSQYCNKKVAVSLILNEPAYSGFFSPKYSARTSRERKF